MDEKKQFYFDFYECETISSQVNAVKLDTVDVLRKMYEDFHDSPAKTVRHIGTRLLELRDIRETDYGYRGIFGKHRKNNLPHAAVAGGGERELPLEPEENLLEKSHFVFYADLSLLIIQRNRYCVNWETLGRYLSPPNYATTLNPIMAPANMRWLASGNVQVKVADITVARPRNPELLRDLDHDINNSIMLALNGTNSAKINLCLRGDARASDPADRYLEGRFKRALRELQESFDVTKLKLLTENTETRVEHPIDLVSDRLSSYDMVEMLGRYPSSSDMWEKLELARHLKDEELIEFYGAQEGRLA